LSFFLLQYAYNIFKCIFSHCVVWNHFSLKCFCYQLYTTCACKGMCGGPSKLKASLTLIQLVNMKQLFLQQYNVMLILNYMVLIIFIYSYLWLFKKFFLLKRLEGINLHLMTSNHKHLFHFFQWNKYIPCLQTFHDTKVNLPKKNQRFNHLLLISLWQIELFTTYSVWFKFHVLL
jgi:hypothetical protein